MRYNKIQDVTAQITMSKDMAIQVTAVKVREDDTSHLLCNRFCKRHALVKLMLTLWAAEKLLLKG